MNKKKGFTIIELIVVMAVIAVLVLLAMPRFMGYTEKARLTELKNNIKQLENAAERYYINEQDWPRGSDVAYTAAELELFAEEIKNRTGAVVTLEESGKYYPIDYKKLQPYVQKPKSGAYILQNPVGEVFHLDKLTDLGRETLPVDDESPQVPEEPEETGPKDIKFSGLPNEAFDNNRDTKVHIDGVKKITWEGDMTNMALTVALEGRNQYYGRGLLFSFKDENGNTLRFLNYTNTAYVDTFHENKGIKEYKFIVPEKAAYIEVEKSYDENAHLIDMYLEFARNPKDIVNLRNEAEIKSINLKWEPGDDSYDKVIVWRNGYIVNSNSTSITEYKDTNPSTETYYNYDIQAFDVYGNATKKEFIQTSTLKDLVTFSGLEPGAFDKDRGTTSERITGEKIVTWDGDIENKAISIDLPSSLTLYFLDDNDNVLPFFIAKASINRYMNSYNNSDNSWNPATVVVPEGATKMKITGTGNVIGIYIIYAFFENPEPVENLKATPTDSSVTLTWESKRPGNYFIYRNGDLIDRIYSTSTHMSFTDTTLYSGETFTYSVRAYDGNNLSTAESVTTATTITGVAFRGIHPGAFDKGTATSITVYSGQPNEITWIGDIDNMVLNFRIYDHIIIEFLDENNNPLDFALEDSTEYTNKMRLNNSYANKDYKVVAPEGSKKIIISSTSNYSKLVDLYVYK